MSTQFFTTSYSKKRWAMLKESCCPEIMIACHILGQQLWRFFYFSFFFLNGFQNRMSLNNRFSLKRGQTVPPSVLSGWWLVQIMAQHHQVILYNRPRKWNTSGQTPSKKYLYQLLHSIATDGTFKYRLWVHYPKVMKGTSPLAAFLSFFFFIAAKFTGLSDVISWSH